MFLETLGSTFQNTCFVVFVLQVEALAVKLTQHEGVFIQEKTEVKKLASFLKQVSPHVYTLLSSSSMVTSFDSDLKADSWCSQASEDAKKLVNHEKSFACAEIESARAVVLKLGEAFEEQERSSEASRAQGPVSFIRFAFKL